MSIFPRPLKKVLGKIIPFSKEDKVPTFNLGSGTADNTTFLRGDGTWASPGSSGYVPYVGATQDVDLGEFGVDAGHIVFDTTPTAVPTDQGTLSWDPDHNTLQLQMNGDVGQLMQDTFYFVKNQSGSLIPKGTVVMADGTLGASGRIKIAPFLADGTYPSKYCMGVTSEDIPNGGDGMVMHFGQIRQINLSAYTDGDILYASDTVAGGFTTVRPDAPNNIVTIAIVIHAASNGVLQVRPTFSSNINDDEGVYFPTTPTNGQVLTFNGISGLWEAQTVPTGITVGTTPVTSGTDGRVFFQSGGVVQQDSSFFWDNTNKRLGVGTSSPLYGLDVNANARLNGISIETTGLNTRSIQQNLAGTLTIAHAGSNNNIQFQVNRGGTAFIPLFIAGLTGHVGVGANSASARLDVRAQGALSTDLILRTRNSADTRNFLVVNGAGDVYNNGAGGVTSNTFYGENVGRSASGSGNTFIGASAGQSNVAGIANTLIGNNALPDNTGGGNNVAIGQNAGRFTAASTSVTTSNQSVFIGTGTRANANSESNQIVIGTSAIGTGSNSVTLGNTSITRTNLRGQVVISGFASAPTGVEGAIYYDSTTKKHYGFDGTNWNALY